MVLLGNGSGHLDLFCNLIVFILFKGTSLQTVSLFREQCLLTSSFGAHNLHE